MSAHKHFLMEKEKIDALFNEGYRISKVKETLSGDVVMFERPSDTNRPELKELHILTADARKYFSTIIVADHYGRDMQGNLRLIDGMKMLNGGIICLNGGKNLCTVESSAYTVESKPRTAEQQVLQGKNALKREIFLFPPRIFI